MYMDKGLTVPKWVLIVWQKITQMPQNLLAQFVGPSPKVLEFNEKRLHCNWASVVRVADMSNATLNTIGWNLFWRRILPLIPLWRSENLKRKPFYSHFSKIIYRFYPRLEQNISKIISVHSDKFLFFLVGLLVCMFIIKTAF